MGITIDDRNVVSAEELARLRAGTNGEQPAPAPKPELVSEFEYLYTPWDAGSASNPDASPPEVVAYNLDPPPPGTFPGMPGPEVSGQTPPYDPRDTSTIARLNEEAQELRDTLAFIPSGLPGEWAAATRAEIERIENEIDSIVATLPDSERPNVVNGQTGQPYTKIEWHIATANGLARGTTALTEPADPFDVLAATPFGLPSDPEAQLEWINVEIGGTVLDIPDDQYTQVINWRTQQAYTEQQWQIEKIEALSREEQRLMNVNAPLGPGGDAIVYALTDTREEMSGRIAALPLDARSEIINAATGKPFTDGELTDAIIARPGLVAGLAATYGDDGTDNAVEFTDALERRTRGMTPAQTAAVIESLIETGEIDAAIQSFVDDYDNYRRVPGTPYRDENDFIADLSAVISAADDPQVAAEVAALMPQQMYFADGQRNAIANGHGADLTIALITHYQVVDPETAAIYTHQVLAPGIDAFTDNYRDVHDTFVEREYDAFYLDAHFGAFGTETERNAALGEFHDEFKDDYEAYDRWASSGIDLLDDTYGLTNADGEPLIGPNAQYELVETLPLMGRTPSGNAALGDALFKEAQGEETFLQLRFDDGFAGRFDDTAAYDTFNESVDLTLTNAATQGAVAAIEDGRVLDANAYIDGLEDSGVLRDLGTTGSKRLLSHLKTIIANGRNGNRAAAILATEELDSAITDLVNRPGLAGALRTSGLLLGGYSLAISNTDAWTNGSDRDRFLAVTSTVGWLAGSFKEGAEIRRAFLNRGLSEADALANWQATNAFFKPFGRITTGTAYISLAFDVVSVLEAAGTGRWDDAAFSSVNALGTALILFPGAYTGIGTVLVLGSAVAKVQYDRVKASNEHENETTERFIAHMLTGSTNPELDEVIRHLRNADSEGRNVGVLIQAAARELGVEPAELFDVIGELPPDDVLAIVEAAHGVDPDGDPLDVASIPLTHPSDEQVGQFVRVTLGGDYYLSDANGNWITDGDSFLVPFDFSTDPDLRYARGGRHADAQVVTPKSVTAWIDYVEGYLGIALS